MYYEINVARKVKSTQRYEHYFATAPRSITYYRDAVRKLREFMVLFPSPEYEIDINEFPEQLTSFSCDEFLLEFDRGKE